MSAKKSTSSSLVWEFLLCVITLQKLDVSVMPFTQEEKRQRHIPD